MSNDSVIVRYSEGRGVNLGKVTNKTASWKQFCAAFSTPTRTKERRKVFDKLTKQEQDDLKSVEGFVMGAQMKDGKRNRQNIQPRDIITLDIDYATPKLIVLLENGLTPISEYEFFVHSSRRHTTEKPRIRLFGLLLRPVTAEEYGPLSRIFAFILEGRINPMPQVDKVSFRPAQMMFKPTASIDGDWLAFRNEGDLIDPDAIFAWFDANYGDHHDYSVLPRAAGEEELRETHEKAEDPTTKENLIGDFCRAFDIPTAIDEFLTDCYAPADDFSEKPRYTYLKGTSTSGAVVEDGGLFLYSHHGSDPCADQLVNAFDLVRIHLYGDLDEGVDTDTPPTKLPSYKKMVEFAREQPAFRKSQAERRYDVAAMFDDVAEDDDPPDLLEESNGHASFDQLFEELIGDGPVGGLANRAAGSPGVSPKKPKSRRIKAPDVDTWFPDALELDQNGNILSTLHNAATIGFNDKRMFGAIGFNEFSAQVVARRDIISNIDIVPTQRVIDPVNGDRWQDRHDLTVRATLEAPNGEGKRGYGMSLTDRNVVGAIALVAHRNSFHPIREYLEEAVDDWDGVERVDTLFITYLGCPDTPYHRETARMIMVASVTRIFEPGHKFDFAPILQGETGIRKSAFIKALYSEAWFGELACKLDDKQQIAEEIAGKWGTEFPEMGGFHKSDHNAAKMFLRRVDDDVRMAYDRRVTIFKRQAVFWGTTNDHKYLKDPTGNRSYWPVHVIVTQIDTDDVAANRAQLWGEAVAIYRAMRAERPRTAGDLPLYLRDPQSQAEAVMLQEEARSEELHEIWAREILEWADREITLQQFLSEIGAPIDEQFGDGGQSTADVLVIRCAFTQRQAMTFAMGKDRVMSDYISPQTIGKAEPLLTGWYKKKGVGYKGSAGERVGGVFGRWLFREGTTPLERKNGYRIVLSASAGESLI